MLNEVEAEPGEKFAVIGEATIGCAATHPPDEKFKLTFDLGNLKTAMPRCRVPQLMSVLLTEFMSAS
jgi:hypothetical protein